MTPEEVRDARTRLGLSQTELAPLLGYSRSGHLCDIERWRRGISPQAVRLLRAYLDGYRPPDWPQR